MSPSGKEDLGKLVIAKKKEISATSEVLVGPHTVPEKEKSYVNGEIPERKNS